MVVYRGPAGLTHASMFEQMANHISAATTVLMDPATGPAEIDRCLNTMLQESRPCYIGVPVDMSYLLCDSSGLQTPVQKALPTNDPSMEKNVVAELRELLEQKTSPIIIVDGNAVRNGLVAQCQKLSEVTGLPTFTTCMGKGAPDEETPNFGGLYNGGGSHPGVKKAVESSDAVFWLGYYPVR